MDEMNQVTPSPTKLPFIEVLRQSQISYELLVKVAADIANVPRFAIHAMIVGNPVAPNDAQTVLAILSQHTGQTWNLDTVDVPVLPTSLK